MSISKIYKRTDIKQKVEALKNNGKKIVFANGCFDVLHVGHIRYLKSAKKFGDILLVAINSDESVHKLKGEGRPMQNENERAEIIAALECVDFVTIFVEDTADDILLELKPDFQAKGTDYTEKNVPERETVLSFGGKIVIAGDPKNHSSTELQNKNNGAK